MAVPGSAQPQAAEAFGAVVRRRSPQHWLVERAMIVLLSHRGLRIVEICKALTSTTTSFADGSSVSEPASFEFLRDQPRSGRPHTIEIRVWQKVPTLIVQTPERFGLPVARWSLRVVSSHLRRRFGSAGQSFVAEPASSFDRAQAAPRSVLAQSRRPELRRESRPNLQALRGSSCTSDCALHRREAGREDPPSDGTHTANDLRKGRAHRVRVRAQGHAQHLRDLQHGAPGLANHDDDQAHLPTRVAPTCPPPYGAAPLPIRQRGARSREALWQRAPASFCDPQRTPGRLRRPRAR
jgi:hypothetical protein